MYVKKNVYGILVYMLVRTISIDMIIRKMLQMIQYLDMKTKH